MLCPKCDYISFDHLASCSNCGNDLSVLSSEINGTVVLVERHSFLESVLKSESAAADQVSEAAPDAGEEQGQQEVQETEMIDFSDDAGEELAAPLEEEISFDLSDFEEGAGKDDAHEDEGATIELHLDEEDSEEEDSGEIELHLEEDGEGISELQLDDAEASDDLEGISLEMGGEADALSLETEAEEVAESPEPEQDAGIDFSFEEHEPDSVAAGEETGDDGDEAVLDIDLTAFEETPEEAVGPERDAGAPAEAAEPEESDGIELHFDLKLPEKGGAGEAAAAVKPPAESRKISLDLSSLSMEKDDSSEPEQQEVLAGAEPEISTAETDQSDKSELAVGLENIDLSDLVRAGDDDGGGERGADSDDSASIEDLSLELETDDGESDETAPIDLTGGDDSAVFDLSVGEADQEESSFKLEDEDDEIIIDLSLETDDK